MEPIRVLHMIGNLGIGGSQVLVINLLRAIDRSKVQFDFIVDRPESDELAATVRELGSRIYSVPTFVGHNIREVQKAWDQFFLEHPEYKILHSHVRSYASIYLPIAKRHGLKTIIHSHSTSNGKGLVSAVKKVLQFPLRYQADFLFACSQEAGRWLYGKYAVLQNNYRMIPNGVDCKRFVFDKAARNCIRNQWGISENAKVIGHIGRIHESKNHGFLIDVFAEIRKHDESIKLLLVGDGELRNEAEHKCKQLGIHESVVFAGAQTDTPGYYCAMDLFLFPSKWEGLPVSVVEAQACGLPCVLADTITKDIRLTNLVEYLPLNLGVQAWAQRVAERLSEPRKPLENVQQLTAFDIEAVAQELLEFYLNLA